MDKVFAFCFDKNYAPYCSAALLSLVISNGNKIRVYCLYNDTVSENDLSALKNLKEKLSIDLTFIGLDESRIKPFKTVEYFTSAMYFRFFLPELLAKEDKVLYLDCDVIVQKDLSELFAIDLDGHCLAGVRDEAAEALTKIDGPHKENYINSGVLLMNLNHLRQDRFMDKLGVLYEQHASKLSLPDQCLLNIYSHGKRLILDQEYNTLVASKDVNKHEWLNLKGSSKILHFIEKIKPWHEASRSHIADFWWSYSNMAGQSNIKPIKCATLNEYLNKCKSLEENGRHEESSKIKTSIIQKLLKEPLPLPSDRKTV